MKFVARSLLILLVLYGLVFALGDVYLARNSAPLWVAFLFAIVIIGFQFLIAPTIIEWVFDIWWEPDLVGAKLPQVNRDFLYKLCADRNVPPPRLGVIPSGTPNAFSFGHTPGDARIVVTSGTIDILTPEELNAVLAHELGHVEHWDFAVMTLAALAPLLLYQLYVFTRHFDRARPIAYSAYLCYLISQYIVLLLNRTREYFADHYSAEVTHMPGALSSALVKIAYGMVRSESEFQEVLHNADKRDRRRLLKEHGGSGALALMGISNVHSGSSLSLSGANPAEAAAVMRWDLVNPWARLYELSSSHPLTALRVRALNQEAVDQHQTPAYPLPEDGRVHWGAFPLEVIIWVAPFVSGALLLSSFILGRWIDRFGIPDDVWPKLLMFTGATWIIRTWYRYHGDFQPVTIGRLIEDVEVSQMRPRAVRLTGEVLGRGTPGLIWSPDLVLRDATGMIFVLYRQSIPFARILFAINTPELLTGKKVELECWFRRGLRPYVELSKLTTEDGATYRAYSRWVQQAIAAVAIAAGYLWLNS